MPPTDSLLKRFLGGSDPERALEGNSTSIILNFEPKGSVHVPMHSNTKVYQGSKGL